MVEPTIALGVIGIIIILGVLFTRLGSSYKFPSVLLLILLGVIVGPVLGFFSPNGSMLGMLEPVVLFALIVVLFDAGYDIRLSRLKRELLPSFQLAILAFATSVLVVVGVAYFLLHMSLQHALLLGAILGSTDITVIMPLVSMSRDRKIKDILSIEAAINSVFAIVLATVSLELFKPKGGATWVQYAQPFLYQIFVGIGLGIIFGYILLYVLKRLRIEHKPELLSVGAILLVYAFAEVLKASGIFAVLISAIVLGNAKPPLKKVISTFEDSISLLMIIFVFVILGTFLNKSLLLSAGLAGLFIALIVFVSRWPASWAYGRSWGNKEKFIFLVGPRGMTCVVLALFFASKFRNPSFILGIVLVVVLVTIMLASLSGVFASKMNHEQKAGSTAMRRRRK